MYGEKFCFHNIGNTDKKIRKVGRGGYSTVYKIRDGIALKLHGIPGKGGLDSLMEAYVTLHLRHPSLVKSEDVEIDDERRLKMYQPLAIYDAASGVKRRGVPPEIREWLWSIAQAVAYLHSVGLVHGDIKGSNVLIYREGKKRIAKLGDTGLTSIIGPLGTLDHTIIAFTKTHRPPEVWRGEWWSFPADIWALGCTFYELAYGHLLYTVQGSDLGYTEAFSSPRELPSDDLGDLIGRMIKINPTERISTFDVLSHSYFQDFKYNGPLKYGVVSLPPPDQTIYKEACRFLNPTIYNPVLLMACSYRLRFPSISLETCLNVSHKLFHRSSILSSVRRAKEEAELCRLIGFRFL